MWHLRDRRRDRPILQGKHPGGQVEDQRRSKVRILVSIRGRAGPRRPAPARFALRWSKTIIARSLVRSGGYRGV